MTNEQRPSVMIATPMYGGMCTAEYVRSLLATMPVLRDAGVDTFWMQVTNESLIPRGRNEIVRLFRDSACSHLMFIDADIGFPPDAVLQLLRVDEGVVCGSYPKKEINWPRVELAAQQGKEFLEDFAGSFVFNMCGDDSNTDVRGVVEVRHGGTGFMLIHRGVFDLLEQNVKLYRNPGFRELDRDPDLPTPMVREFFKAEADDKGEYLSEDYYFCDLWRTHGGKVWLHPFIELTHTGTHTYRGNLVRSGGTPL
jgi:hypothetical protein